MTVKSLADGATKLFPIWSVLVGFLALYDPSLFLWYGKDAISVGLGIIMLGMGLTLSVEDFTEVLKKPKLVVLGAFLQFSIMPAWASLIAFMFQMPAEMAVGLILVASCPGGTASNVVVFFGRGQGGTISLSNGVLHAASYRGNSLANPLLCGSLFTYRSISTDEEYFYNCTTSSCFPV